MVTRITKSRHEGGWLILLRNVQETQACVKLPFTDEAVVA